jgi:hypothetical protein
MTVTVEQLIESAAGSVGRNISELADVVEPLELILASCQEEGLSAAGWHRARGALFLALTNRLAIKGELARHPEVRDERIDGPLVITCLPRTGTTFLHRLMAQDPGNRVLRYSETVHPVSYRLPDSGLDARETHTARALEMVEAVSPGFQALHPIDAESPEECRPLLLSSFRSLGFEFFLPTGRYHAWLGHRDHLAAYQHYLAQLQILQRQQRGARWLLKDPGHLDSLDHLTAVLPDARIIQIHRDPADMVASNASFRLALQQMRSDGVGQVPTGQKALSSLSARARLAIRFRDRYAGGARFYDVRYQDLVADPIGVVKRLYADLGMVLEDDAQSQMRDFLARHPKGRRGFHHYSLAQFGLTRDEVRAQFDEYCRRYRV